MRGRRIIVDQINLIRINVIVTYKSDAIRQLKTLSIKFLYRNMDDDEEQCRVGLGHYRKKSGQKTCAHCSKSYNNYSIPPYCTCNFFLGGTFKKAVQKLDTKMLTGSLASTRVNIAGPNVRTFVLLVYKIFKRNYLIFLVQSSLICRMFRNPGSKIEGTKIADLHSM